jgi:hypothetical protein
VARRRQAIEARCHRHCAVRRHLVCPPLAAVPRR